MTLHIKLLHPTKKPLLLILFNSSLFEQPFGVCVQQSQGQGTVFNNVTGLSLTLCTCVVPLHPRAHLLPLGWINEVPIRQFRFWLHTEHNKCLCLPAGYGEMLLEAAKGIHFTLNALLRQQRCTHSCCDQGVGCLWLFSGWKGHKTERDTQKVTRIGRKNVWKSLAISTDPSGSMQCP